MGKFPALPSCNVFTSEAHGELHIKGSWFGDQKPLSCWAGFVSWSAGIFTASVCGPVTGWECPPTPRPAPPFFKFIYSASWQSHSEGIYIYIFDSQDPVCLLTSNYSCAELLKNEMRSNKQAHCPLTCGLYGYFACSQLFVNNSSSGCSQKNIFDVSGYVISLAFFICCRMTRSNLADELC